MPRECAYNHQVNTVRFHPLPHEAHVQSASSAVSGQYQRVSMVHFLLTMRISGDAMLLSEF
jgi:hypothetical protein